MSRDLRRKTQLIIMNGLSKNIAERPDHYMSHMYPEDRFYTI